MGRLSLQMLLEQIESGTVPPARQTVAPELIVRGSTAPARGSADSARSKYAPLS
jgi:DNA-binding LacI/PurR family transcriptional regulator